MDNKDLISFLDKWISDSKDAQEDFKEKGDFRKAFDSIAMQTAYLNVKNLLKLNST